MFTRSARVGFSSEPTDIMPWKIKMACHSGADESNFETDEESQRSAWMHVQLAGLAALAGTDGVLRSVRKTRYDESPRRREANFGPRKPAAPVMRMFFDMMALGLVRSEGLG